MVKLIVIVRCVPEDVYLSSLESAAPTPAKHADIKKFKLVVRDPEQWYIGRLAVEIKTSYSRLYKRPFGEIKYLKDDDDDCDLDPELLVADLLVDEGKAEKDGADQQKTVKVIQEQGRAIRQGSVIPDLTPAHYQPPARPPVPRFPDVAEKRRTEELQTDDRPSKRRRLDQIEEETNCIVNSIERDALNGNSNHTGPEAELKQESPELSRTWVNTGPATIDELEFLPEAPVHFKPQSKKNTRGNREQQDPALEIRESSAVPQDDQQSQREQGLIQGPDNVANRGSLQQFAPEEHTPNTPNNARNMTQDTGGQTVSMLNSMKSNSPMTRQSTSSSANKFRKPIKNVYDYPESDIEDTQMSPRSRASRTRFTPKLTPKLVQQTPFSKSTLKSKDTSFRRSSQQSSAVQESPTRQNKNYEDPMDVDGDNENQLPHPRDQREISSHTKANDEDEDVDVDQADETSSRQIQRPRQSVNNDGSSILGSDETWSVHEDGKRTKKKKARKSMDQTNSAGGVSTPRSASVFSSTRVTPHTGNSTQQTSKRKRTVPTRISDVHSRSGISELDSPGMQLSETLRQSSPVTRQSKGSSQNVSEAVTESTNAPESMQTAGQVKDTEMDDIQRPPESVTDGDMDTSPMKTPKRSKTKSKASKSITADVVLKCLSCWNRGASCNNDEPKCHTCNRDKKNCQILGMTEAEADAERERRNAAKLLKSSQKSSAKKKGKARPQSVKTVVSAINSEEETENQKGQEDVEDTRSRRKSNRTPSKSQTSKASVSVSDEGDASVTESKPRALQSSQSISTKSKSKKKQLGTPSQAVVPVQDTDKSSQNENKPVNSEDPSTAGDEFQVQTKPGSSSKERTQTTTSKQNAHTSPDAGKKRDINGKDSELLHTLETSASIKEVAPASPSISKDVPSVLADKTESFEGRVASTGKILPPGMTEEQYESLVGSRANLTEKQRTEKNLRIQKMGKNRDPTPSLKHESSAQDLAGRSKQDTASVKSSQQAPPSSQSTKKDQSKPPPSTQPTRAPASVKSNTPASVPARSKSNPPAANTSAKARLKLQPAANTSAKTKTKSPNPPFQPHQPQPLSSAQRKSILPTSFASASTMSPSLLNSKSLKDVRAALQSQSRSGSGANTPQPVFTTAAKIAEIKRVANPAASKKKMFSLSDDDGDDDSSASDEEMTDEDEDDNQKTSNKTAPKVLNGNGRGNVTVRRRTPSDSGSASETDSGDEDDSE